MTEKQIAILLAILLAISIIFNIRCEWGSHEPETLTWAPATITDAEIAKGAIQISLCSTDSNGTVSCSTDSIGMRGGSIDFETLAPMFADTNVNCLSYSFWYDASGTEATGLKVVFHANRYDEASGRIIYVDGPSYVSDMPCPTNCPM